MNPQLDAQVAQHYADRAQKAIQPEPRLRDIDKQIAEAASAAGNLADSVSDLMDRLDPIMSNAPALANADNAEAGATTLYGQRIESIAALLESMNAKVREVLRRLEV